MSSLSESSIDFPKDSLCPEVWQRAVGPDGLHETWLLTGEAEAAVLAFVQAALAKTGFQKPSSIHIVGSIASTQWTETCDVDVHLVGIAPAGEASDEASKKLRAAARELEASAFKTEIGKHPLELYAQGNQFQDLMSAGCYDVEERKWLVGPDIVDPDFNPYSELMADVQKTAGKEIAKIRNQIFSLYEMAVVVSTNAGTDFGESLRKPFADKLREIAQTYAEARAKRRAFSDPASEEEALARRSSREWKTSDAAFKLLGKYGYVPILREFTKLSDLLDSAGGSLDAEIAEKVLAIVKDSIADADSLSETEMFGEEEQQVDEGAFQQIALAALLAIPGVLPAAQVKRAVQSVPRAEQRVGNPKIQQQLKSAKKLGRYDVATATNVLSWCLFAEAGGESFEGKQAVASVISNRAGGDPSKMVDAAAKPWAFSCFNEGNPWGLTNPQDGTWKISAPKAAARNAGVQKAWSDSVILAAQLASGQFKSTIGSRNSYYNEQRVKRSNPKVLRPGGWGYQMTQKLAIGKHVFGYLPDNDGYRRARVAASKASSQAKAGQKLDLRAKAKLFVPVKSGDTLWSIARANGTTVAAIAKLNRIKPSDPLTVGRKLRVK